MRDYSQFMLEGSVDQPSLPERFSHFVQTYMSGKGKSPTILIYHCGPAITGGQDITNCMLYRAIQAEFSMEGVPEQDNPEIDHIHAKSVLDICLQTFIHGMPPLEGRETLLRYCREHSADAFFDPETSIMDESSFQLTNDFAQWYLSDGLYRRDFSGIELREFPVQILPPGSGQIDPRKN